MEISHDEDSSMTSLPETDLVLDWTDDLEVSFRFLADQRVNPTISYPMYPLPEDLVPML
jgi:hypothetical protein